ncbi:serine/threonine-protein kinase ATR isoform X2 [Periplaneta americana]|uniref:serine/threonine-protein kinase ATR isoform X2 n=1 Tax=Periplaneta americana TaxID=6978 RepID=UPI0037E8AE6E
MKRETAREGGVCKESSYLQEMDVQESDEEYINHLESSDWVPQPSMPKSVKIWKLINMPLTSMYKDLDNSLKNLSILIDSVVNTCKGCKSVYLPNRREKETAEHYTAFTTWLLGRLLYLMSSSALSSLLEPSAAAQISVLKLLETHRSKVFVSVITEYLYCLEDIIDVQSGREMEQTLVLKRFKPNCSYILNKELDLTQFEVEITANSDVCVRLQTVIHQIFTTFVSSIVNKDRSVCERLWNLLCSALTHSSFTVKAQAIALAAQMLQERGFSLDVATKFYEALQAILSRFGTFTSEEFADDEKSKLAHSLKDFIDVIIELNGTESEKLDALLFSTMKFVVLEWKPMKLTDETVQSAASLLVLLLKKLPDISIEGDIIKQLVKDVKINMNVIPLLQWRVYEDLISFISTLATEAQEQEPKGDKFADTRGENETKERTDGDSSSEELVEDKISENKYIDEENEDILIVNIDEGEKREEECISDEIQMESAYEDEATEAISVEGRYLVEVPWPVTNPESREKRTKCRKVNSTEAGDSLVTSTRTGSDRIEECGGPSTSSSSSSTSPDDDDDDDDVKLDDSNYSESVGVKIYCIEGSYTWYKLRKQLKSLIKCVKDKTEALEVVRILQPVHSIVRCAMEAVVLLENNCRCPPAASPYLFVFFDGSIGDVVECLTKVLSTVSFTRIEDFEEVFVICVEIVGILLHMPESVHAPREQIKTAITLLSVPWHKYVSPLGDMDRDILGLAPKLPEVSGLRIKLMCLEYLLYIPFTEVWEWRFELMKFCIKCKRHEYAIAVVHSLPYVLHIKMFSPNKTSVEILQRSLEISKKNVHLQKALASVVGDISCVISGSCLYLRKMDASQITYKMVCVECHPDRKLYCASELDYMETFEARILKCLDLVNSEYSEVRILMINALRQLSTHLPSFHQSDMPPRWIQLFSDDDSSVRLHFASCAKYLVFNPKWVEEKQSESETLLEEHIPLSQKDKLQLSHSIPLMLLCVEKITTVVYESLMKRNRELQHTIILALRSLGRVPLDCVLMPTFTNLLLLIAHPASLVLHVGMMSVGEIAEAHNVSPYDIYIRFKKEMCEVLVNIALLNHSLGGLQFGTSLQHVVRALGFSSCSDFLQKDSHHLLPFLVPAMLKLPGAVKLLDDIGKFMMIEPKVLIEESFQYIYPHVYLYETEEILVSCLEYMERFTGIKIKDLKRRSFKVIHNELLLHYECKKERVLTALRDLATEDPDYKLSHEHMGLEEIADYLKPRFLGILIFFDSKLVTRKVSDSVKKKALSSLPEIIRLMGKKHITPVRFKVLATLRTALKLNYSNFPDLNVAAWDAFVHSVDVAYLGPLLSTIFVSLLPFLHDFTDEIGSIFSFLILRNSETLQDYFKELYFVQPIEGIIEVCQEIQSVINTNGPPSFMDMLSVITSSIKHDNVDVQLSGLEHLRFFLEENKESILACIVGADHVDPIIREIMDSLLLICQDEDQNLRVAAADCIGAVGAVDPGLLSWRELQKARERLPLGVDTESFSVLALNHLARSFQHCRDTLTVDAFSLAMQELLKIFDISPHGKSNKENIWDKFSKEVQEIMTPFLTSYYKNSVCPIAEVPHPIIGSSHGKTLNDWACNWAFTILKTIKLPNIKAVFEACTISLKRDLQTLLFFLPFILMHGLVTATPAETETFLEEILAVLNASSNTSSSSGSDVGKLAQEFEIRPDEKPNFPVTLSERELETKKSPNVDHNMLCAKTVFTLIDFLWCWLQDWRSANVDKCRNPSDDPVYFTVEAFLSKIPYLTVAMSNMNQGEYPRALKYLEKYIKLKPEEFQAQLWLFMKIYANMNEPDAVHGIMALREREPSIEELIIAHQVTGQLQEAAACYERMAQEGKMSREFSKGMVQCYLWLDQPITALRIAQGIVSERPRMSAVMKEFEAEAFWRLQKFDELSNMLFSQEAVENKSWGLEMGKTLFHFQTGKRVVLLQLLRHMRKELLDGLGIISLEKGSYQEEYQKIIRLHILNEIERAELAVKTMEKNEYNLDYCLFVAQDMIVEWGDRLKYVQRFSRTREPILRMRRILLALMKARIEEKLPAVASFLDEELGKYWLESAKTARNDGLHQQAYTYILNAEKFRLKELFVEKAKLYWEKGEQDPAFLTLRRGLEEYFSDGNECSPPVSNSDEMNERIRAEARLLLATYNDETVNVDMDTNISNYKNAVEACQQWEKSSVCLAQYYDRVLAALSSEEDEDKSKVGEIQVNIVNYYGKSLLYGCNYIYQSMPRVLSIWFDFGTQVSEKEKDKDRTKKKMAALREMRSNLDTMTRFISQLVKELPPYMFLTAFSQLVSRICHPHPDVFRYLKTIIAHVIVSYPQQSLWMLMSVYKSSSPLRVKRCEEVLNDSSIRKSNITKLLQDFVHLTEKLIDLSEKPITVTAKQYTFSLSTVLASLPRLLRSPDFSEIMVPCQQFTIIQLPTDEVNLYGHCPFPKDPVYIKEMTDDLFVLASLQKPRRVTFIGTDGEKYMMMCKAKDDLRKDFRFMEFNNVVNRYLRNDPESRQRGLHIRTYHVVPLNEECGIVEWVPMLVAYRNIILKLYRERGNTLMTAKEYREHICDPSTPHNMKKTKFLNVFLPKHPPVFDEWFRNTFAEPYEWYRARTSYTRTTAVMSMVGYILGLGDRHGENILLDTVSGEAVHVDFNCIFNKGEQFTCPERVPFRLTHNMVAGMGPMGVEGIFRKSCEITLRILRTQIETLMSVLRPFVYDPMVVWPNQSSEGNQDSRSAGRKDYSSTEITNTCAVKNLEDIEKRLQGMVRMKMKQCSSLALSVEGQANNLILEASNVDNLCEMYIGWGPFL